MIRMNQNLRTFKPKRRVVRHEDNLQIQCRSWFDAQYPALSKSLNASANGATLAGDKLQRCKQANRLKAMGCRPGWPDIFIAYPIFPYGGLFVELKHGKNKTTPEQKDMLKHLSETGYYCMVAYSLEEFMEIVKSYFSLEERAGV